MPQNDNNPTPAMDSRADNRIEVPRTGLGRKRLLNILQTGRRNNNMSTNNNTLSPAIVEATQPKPTRNEIIDALTAVRIEQLKKDQEEKLKLRELLSKEAENELKEFFASNISSFDVCFHLGNETRKLDSKKGKYVPAGRIQGVNARYELAGLPNALERKLVEIARLPNYASSFDERVIRKQIREKMEGIKTPQERVFALVNNPASRSALEKILSKLK